MDIHAGTRLYAYYDGAIILDVIRLAHADSGGVDCLNKTWIK